jgi:HEAT repeat protein
MKVMLSDLLMELTSGDDQRAEAAALSVSAYGSKALSVLGPLAHSSQADHRWWAIRSLAELPDGQAGLYLIQALTDGDPAVRQCAALSLSQRPDERAVPALVEAMASKDALLARLAANALASTGAGAVPALLDVLENGRQPVRLEAARALAHIGDQRSIPALFDALDEDSALMEYWANEALERMGVGMMFFKP